MKPAMDNSVSFKYNHLKMVLKNVIYNDKREFFLSCIISSTVTVADPGRAMGAIAPPLLVFNTR